MSAALEARLARLAPDVRDSPSFMLDGVARSVLFFSFTDGSGRATTFSVGGPDADAAWAVGAERLRERGDARWLRVDWVNAAERTCWKDLRTRLARTKRNYFRLGIALDARFECAFLETELNANAMLYGGPTVPTAVVNEGNFTRYAAQRHGLAAVDFDDETPVWLFSTKGLFVGDDLALHRLDGLGRDAGRRSIARLDPDLLLDLIRSGSGYLASQVREDGRFHYGWHPCFDRPIPSYNSLRHASSLYAMLEAWEVTRDPVLQGAIDRALAYLTGELIKPAVLPGGENAAFLVDPGAEIKLGGNAVCLLALVKYSELMATDAYRPLLEKLALGILHMQDATSGRFVHVLHHPSLEVKQPFRIIYYEGEAAFGLMRLFNLTGDKRWLAAVERAFGHFIRSEHWQAHDHWLSYCANELTRHRPREEYFRFGLANIADHLDFVLERITTFPTLLELMMAAERMVSRLRADAASRHLLAGFDLPKFYRALHFRAHYLLNGHFWPELAMFFADPAKITGSFFIRHHAFRIRIDDVEHYLSGLIAYRRYLIERPAGHEDLLESVDTESGWTAASVARAAIGRWIVPPPEGWSARGLCIFGPAMRARDMVVVRQPGEERGIPPSRLAALSHPPAALITTAPDAVRTSDAPILSVANSDAAVVALGAHARAHMTGKVIGVTGSAGKTTVVAMLTRALAPWGPVGRTRRNANLPHGIAWNLASIPWDTPHTVLELAIGRMRHNARLARPDVAVFTNVLPAHLEYHRDLRTIAEHKSAIFEGMAPGSVAVLNRDMTEWAYVHDAAQARGLRTIEFGRSAEAAFRLLDHDPEEAIVAARTPEGDIRYPLAAPGEHMALNSLAVLAVLSALGLPLAPGVAALRGFTPLAGRGDEFLLPVSGGVVTVIDDAYNANPGSMEAAIGLLARKAAARRIAVLGEMLELGADARTYHTALAALVNASGVDRVYVIGRLYIGFWEALAPARRGGFAASLEELKSQLQSALRVGDIVLFKGSHDSGIHQIVHWLKYDRFQPTAGEAIA
ncbi:glutamate ligase [Sphingomonas cannabina]|uniref:Mur ligase family protein n=1 Tax=Sphingomonas cannabina TaxID=2899123 RepID=UPI001EFEF6E6|nr:Mur ligase family protein [Sphingomonas cannabina]UIJ44853.1 glutamate ligase [Sphingomonas cannabina]